MLLGEYKHSLDPKNRIFIPAKYREELGESFIVAQSMREACLRIYSKEEWEAYIAPIKRLDGKDRDRIIRTLTRNASQVSADSQGRIVLTPALIEFAKLQKNAVIVGCGGYAEIWSETNHAAMVEEEDMVDMKALLESYGL